MVRERGARVARGFCRATAEEHVRYLLLVLVLAAPKCSTLQTEGESPQGNRPIPRRRGVLP
jgi:hypothetical protein